MKTSLFVALALCATVSAPIAKAQGVFNMGGLTGTLSMDDVTQSEEKRAQGVRRGTSSTRKMRKSAIVGGNTRFRVSRATRQRTVANWLGQVTRMQALNAGDASALQRAVTKRDTIAAIGPFLSRYGLRTDDVADATALYLVSAWYGVRGSTQAPPRALMRGVRQQVRQAFLSNPRFASALDTDKQQMSDFLILQTMVTDQSITASKGKPQSMARARQSIRQGVINNFKLDLAKMKLTAQGLRS